MPDITLEKIDAYEEKRRSGRYKPDDKLSMIDAAEALSTLGYPITYATLSLMATRRSGPPYYKFGKYTFYRYGDLAAWAATRMKRIER